MRVLQNKIAYITGTSSGIGKSLALKLLDENYTVIGISRKNGIEHPNFSFIQLDLLDEQELDRFEFEVDSEDSVILINNAGILGEIGAIGNIKDQAIIDVIQVNVIAPEVLMNKFVSTYKKRQGNYHIINISSGAGKYPIGSWAAYCSSKSAIDLFSQTLKTEFEVNKMSHWKIHSIAPGVVDTNMQNHIRQAEPEDFSIVQKFIDYKKNGELFTPEFVAEKLYLVINKANDFEEVLISVRDL